MNSCVPDQPTVQRLMAEIEASTPRPHHASLLAVTERLIPDCPCRFALTRGGWYRSGGLVRPDGERVAEQVEAWVEQEMAACGDDLGEFLDRHGEGDLLVTRHTGRTHYFVAPYGSAPGEFLQMEVEELQEVLDRRLWNPDAPPADAQELLDPIAPAQVAPQPLGASRYHFRRLSDLRQVTARLPAPVGGIAPLVRFMREWSASRASAHFCEHWVVGLREHHDRYNNVVLTAAPVSRHARELKPFHWNHALSGLEAANQLQAFDRAAGYPGAWYFHLVAGGLTPRDMAYAVMRDLEAGFGYLADAEAALLQGWLRAPYSV
ncbi:MAG: hypothetical protein HZB71_06315 [Betaproteobacteria bacterium]|nr:hypothetical protein [Betaproteobacteria bacterium]